MKKLTNVYTREMLGIHVPVVGVMGTPLELAVFDLAMDAAGATELGKRDWHTVLEEDGDGKMMPVRIGAKVQLMFCVPTPAMNMTFIHIATMPEHDWMEPKKRAALAERIEAGIGPKGGRA